MATLIVDDLSSSIHYSGNWTETTSRTNYTRYFSGSTATLTGVGGTAALEYTFQGTSISVWSAFSFPQASPLVTTIDGKVARTTPYDSSGALYKSPTLPDGIHSFSMSATQQMDVDFLTVEAGLSTPLLDRLLIVDDSEPSFQYSGNWQTSSRSVRTHKNTIHWSQTVGDTFTFGWTGSYFAMYGVLDTGDAGTVTSTFSIDGKAPAQYSASYLGSDSGEYLANTNFYFASSLDPGNHTGVLTVTQIMGSQAFAIDYVVYTSSFATLSSKPGWTAGSISSSTYGSPTGTALPTSSSTNGSSAPAGAIAGGVIGGIAVLAVIAFFVWWRLKRRSRMRTDASSPINQAINTLPPASPMVQHGQSPPYSAQKFDTPSVQPSISPAPIEYLQPYPGYGSQPSWTSTTVSQRDSSHAGFGIQGPTVMPNQASIPAAGFQRYQGLPEISSSTDGQVKQAPLYYPYVPPSQ